MWKIESGLLNKAEFIASPHHNHRPDTEEISLLVIHNISLPPGQFGGSYIRDFFLGQLNCDEHPYFEQLKALKVSSHLLIERCGLVLQFVPFDKRAWHAGVSSFNDRENCNDFSIGVELEGVDDSPYETAQYQVLAEITREIMKNYPKITQSSIVGHQDIAPGRKTDPGPAFDWAQYYDLIGEKK